MTYGERFEEALRYAARLHRAQMRKGTNIPYVTHLLAVAAIVGENGGTEDEVIAALLALRILRSSPSHPGRSASVTMWRI